MSVLMGGRAGEILLTDGRRFISQESVLWATLQEAHASSSVMETDNIHVIHSDFRMIALANRPGFPFLGRVSDAFAAKNLESIRF